ncbi:MAG: mechanosensitive ion channel [Flavobacteriaceae bacterium]|nr:mechanosensitive ion channel [Flavobacteriaceae bacterium]MDZ4148555.1 mechanosensitive ion channel [Flavobacteriaceae bacterium]
MYLRVRFSLTSAMKFNAFIDSHLTDFVQSIILIVIFLIIRYILLKLVRRFSLVTDVLENRTKLIIRYINVTLFILFILFSLFVWGVDFREVSIVFSSVFAIIGVAMFAQWSILSNITAGVILFFTFPFKIGDRIRVLDKDFLLDLTILDIKAFYLLLENDEGENITYPNNLLLQKGVIILNQKDLHTKEDL